MNMEKNPCDVSVGKAGYAASIETCADILHTGCPRRTDERKYAKMSFGGQNHDLMSET